MSRREHRAERPDYELLDAGEGRRLERFGARVVDRPAPAAGGWLGDRAPWAAADLAFDGGRWHAAGRSVEAASVEPWEVEIAGLTLELRATASGGVGLYPEHALNLPWLEAEITRRARAAAAAPVVDRPAVLNLFAHTGLATLAAARAGAAVTHVDSARGAVAWARSNAERSALAEAPVRWIVDDAAEFVEREGRRGRRYDGIVLDPPSFGRAGRRRWRLEEALPDLLRACAAVAGEEAFVLLTAHTTGLDAAALEGAVRDAFGGRLETVPLSLEATSGARLELGWAVRRGGGTVPNRTPVAGPPGRRRQPPGP